tara:strand:+ start:26 stop:1090 length:1065 start_codon:yes stop_codon:yes gene_type:complete
MAYTTINKHTDYFNTLLYTGNGGTNAQTGVGFQPDWTWIKNRSGSDMHSLYDSVRGVNKILRTNGTNAESTQTDGLTAFGTDGFTVGAAGSVNTNSNNFVAWNWKAGTTGSGTTTGTGSAKAYSYSVNTTAGFSIVTYKGNGSAGQQIPHHLGVVPQCIILKPMDRADNWRVYHVGTDNTSPGDYQLKLNNTNTRDDGADVWNDTIPTSTYFTLGSNAGVVTDNEDFIAYCFANKTGYSRFGSYEGNGESDGTFVYTGFKPALVIIKGTISGDGDAGQSWELYDNKREGRNSTNDALHPNLNSAEGSSSRVDLYANGFRAITNSDGVNDDESRYVYLAFGQSLVGTNNIPNNAR